MSIRDRLEDCEGFHVFEELAKRRCSDEELLAMDQHAAAHGTTTEHVLMRFMEAIRGKSPKEAIDYMRTLMGPGSMLQ